MKKLTTILCTATLLLYATVTLAKSETEAELPGDPIVRSVTLELDINNSSKQIVQALSVDGLIDEQNIPKMKVDIYQSGKRVMTGTGTIPASSKQSNKNNIEFIYEADVAKQKFTLSELTPELKQKISDMNPDLTASSESLGTKGQNKAYYQSFGTDELEANLSGYIYPTTYVRITAIDPIFIILSRTYLRTNGVSNRSSIVWCNAYYYHSWKTADGYSWPLDTTWFRESGNIDWPTPSYWTSFGYTASTQATYGNWDWGYDDEKTTIKHNISFTVTPSGLATFQYTHEDFGEDRLLIRGLFDAASYF